MAGTGQRSAGARLGALGTGSATWLNGPPPEGRGPGQVAVPVAKNSRSGYGWERASPV